MSVRKVYTADGAEVIEASVRTARGETVWVTIPNREQGGVYIGGILYSGQDLVRLGQFYLNGGLDDVVEQREDGLYRWSTRDQDFVRV